MLDVHKDEPPTLQTWHSLLFSTPGLLDVLPLCAGLHCIFSLVVC